MSKQVPSKGFFEDFLEPGFSGFKAFEPIEKIRFPEIRTPLVDVVDKGKNIVVTIELPGINKKDIDVDATETHIRIDAEANHEVEEENKDNFYKYERRYKSFSRTIPMPQEIKPEKVKGEFSNGVLELTAPKRNPPKTTKKKKVKIN